MARITPGLKPWHVQMEAVLDGIEGKADDALAEVNGRLSAEGLSATFATLGQRKFWPVPQRDATIVQRFETGHGWGVANATDDTTNPSPLAQQSVKLTPTASSAHVEKSGLALDLSGGNRLLVWIDAPAGTDYIIYAGDTGLANNVYWAGSIIEDGWGVVELSAQAVTATTGAPVLSAVAHLRIRFNANEPEGHVGGVAIRTEASSPYPNGVISFTFDDSNVTDHTLARPILSRHGFPATSFLITGLVDSGADYLTTELAKRLQVENGWEMAGHAATLAAHDARFTTLTTAEVEAEFSEMRRWLDAFGSDSGSWASPGGQSNTAVWEIAQQYFNMHRSVGSQINAGRTTTAPLVNPRRVAAPSYDSAWTTGAIQTEIDKAVADGGWLILTLHGVLAGASSGQSIGAADLTTIVDYVAASAAEVRTVGEVFHETRRQ